MKYYFVDTQVDVKKGSQTTVYMHQFTIGCSPHKLMDEIIKVIDNHDFDGKVEGYYIKNIILL